MPVIAAEVIVRDQPVYFEAMGKQGMANLSAVAPGISSALLTTVVGLLIAIPASWGYNVLSDRVRSTSVKVRNFTDQLVADIARHHVRHDGGAA